MIYPPDTNALLSALIDIIDDENQKSLCRTLARAYAESNLSTDIAGLPVINLNDSPFRNR